MCRVAGSLKNGEPRVLPIYQSTTFKYETSEQMAKLFDLEESGYFYTRLQNPTNDAVASKIAALEGGVAAMLTSSGQAANFFACFNICEAGDHIVSATGIYWRDIQSAVCYPRKSMGSNVHSSTRMPVKRKSARRSVRIQNYCSAKRSPIRE